MTQFNELPELIISIVIKTAFNSYVNENCLYALKCSLPLLAINQKWRQVGLPQLYKKLVFLDPDTLDCHSSRKKSPASNISLFTKPKYMDLVTRLDINNAIGSPGLISVPKDLVEFIMHSVFEDIFGMEDMVSSFRISEALSDEKKMMLIAKIVKIFAGWFTNIRTITLKFKGHRTGEVQFATQLVSAYGKQLKDLVCDKNLLKISLLPTQLATLECPGKEEILSKVNLLPLQYLKIRYQPSGLSWSFFWTDKNPNDKALEFPNLTTLVLSKRCYNDSDTSSAVSEESTLPKLQFPKLRRLQILVYDASNFDFEVDTVPDHLVYLEYSGRAHSIGVLCKLPVKSVDRFELMITDDDPEFTDEFYTAINCLNNQLKVVRRWRLSLRCNISLFDLRQVNITNLTYLDFHMPSPELCRDWLVACPNILMFGASFTPAIREICSDRDLENLVFPELADHRIHYLHVRINRVVSSIKEKVVGYSLCLLKSLKNLDKVEVTEYCAGDIWMKVHKSKYQYPHLSDIEFRTHPY